MKGFHRDLVSHPVIVSTSRLSLTHLLRTSVTCLDAPRAALTCPGFANQFPSTSSASSTYVQTAPLQECHRRPTRAVRARVRGGSFERICTRQECGREWIPERRGCELQIGKELSATPVLMRFADFRMLESVLGAFERGCACLSESGESNWECPGRVKCRDLQDSCDA
jgi:hypothetical protein